MRYENDRPIYLQVIEDISRRLIQGELILGFPGILLVYGLYFVQMYV